jgi:SAM-dependent methyltransferase
MPSPNWNERYATDDLPWDSGTPDAHLVDFVRTVAARGRALDVGCGTGTNALWLARQGFDVLGLDVSSLAIERARAKLGDEALLCRFAVGDFLTDEIGDGPFDLVFDRGCFHVFDEAEQRKRFVERVGATLREGGLWLSLTGSTEGPARDVGPPRRTLRDVAHAIEPQLEVVEIRAVQFHADTTRPAAAWLCLSRRRSVPAQPSTRR